MNEVFEDGVVACRIFFKTLTRLKCYKTTWEARVATFFANAFNSNRSRWGLKTECQTSFASAISAQPKRTLRLANIYDQNNTCV